MICQFLLDEFNSSTSRLLRRFVGCRKFAFDCQPQHGGNRIGGLVGQLYCHSLRGLLESQRLMAGVRKQAGFGDLAFDGGQGDLSRRPVEDFNVKFPRLLEEMKKMFSGLARATQVPRRDEFGTAIAIRFRRAE